MTKQEMIDKIMLKCPFKKRQDLKKCSETTLNKIIKAIEVG